MAGATRPRVCLISLHFAEYAGRLARALAAHCELLVVVYDGNARDELGEHYQRVFDVPGITLRALNKPRSAWGVLANCWRLTGWLRAFAPKILHVQECPRDELVLALLLLPAIPIVLTVHDPEPHSGQDARAFHFSRFRLYRWVDRRRATAAITHGRCLSELVEHHWPNLRGHVHSVAHGPLGQGDREAVVDTTDRRRLLFFGRIYAYKGLRYFVEAVRGLHASGVPVIGVVAGRGSDLDTYRSAMSEAGCFEVHDHYIPAAEVDQLFRSARAVVLPYTDGTQSGVAAMALGYGRPVIATAVGAIPELVRDGVSGLLVPVQDVAALRAAVSAIVQDDALYARLSAGARALRDGELSWDSIAAHTVGIYHRLTEGPMDSGGNKRD